MNILLILTDQQRWDAVGYISPFVSTPNLDQLAASSLIFTHAFVQSPQCQPSRASLMTGRYPTAHRTWWNEIGLAFSERTIANYLAEAGYHTAYFGKMHLARLNGPVNESKTARHFGFHHTFLTNDWARLIQQLGNNNRIQNEFYGTMGKDTWTGSISGRELHHEDVITDYAIEFIKQIDTPFFVVVGYHGPHPPYAAPSEFTTRYDRQQFTIPTISKTNHADYRLTPDEWRELKLQYYGQISWIDDNIGKLLEVVDDDTVVIFTSDHGDILGDHGLFSKGLYAYEGNIRVPLLIRTKKHPHRVLSHLVQSIDLVPTILKLLDLKIPAAIQGNNLLTTKRNYVLSMIGHNPRLRMIRTNELKYWVYGDEETLFNLVDDPEEETNAIDNQEFSQFMRRLLVKALIKAEDPLPLPL